MFVKILVYENTLSNAHPSNRDILAALFGCTEVRVLRLCNVMLQLLVDVQSKGRVYLAH